MTRRYGRAPRGERIREATPAGHWNTLTLLGAMTQQGMLASMTVESPTDGDVFLAYLDEVLCPQLQAGQVVVMDNLSVHKVAGVRERIEAVGATLLYLPPYSPDFNPIEQAWSKIKQKLRADNPVRGIEKPKDGRRERAISPEEYQRLGSAFDELLKLGANPWAVYASRVIALSGCRRGEVFGLRKTEVDAPHSCFRFGDTKSGQQMRPLGSAVFEVMAEAPMVEGSEYVFPAARGKGHLLDVKVFRRACEAAGLPGLTLHGLRHGYASVAGELGYADATIGVLLGHRSNTISGRYTHIPDPAAVAAAGRVAATIARRMKGETVSAKVVNLPKRR